MPEELQLTQTIARGQLRLVETKATLGDLIAAPWHDPSGALQWVFA